MKLVYIYGPPAVGKLTVAKQLAGMTGFKLFHNHLTSDYVSSLFPVRDAMSNALKCEVAYKMFEAAAKNNLNLVFTMAHEKVHDSFVRKIIKIIEKYHGKVLFVQLFCAKEKLYTRVTKKSRKQFGKTKTVNGVKDFLKRNSKLQAIPYKKSLVIDNTDISPKKCAERIKKYYKL